MDWTSYYTKLRTAIALNLNISESINKFKDTIQRIWDLQSLGIVNKDNMKIATQKYMMTNIEFNGEGYQAELPWKSEDRW